MPLALGPQCCCCGDCPTQEATGLPESLRLAFNVLTSEATGIPADQTIGDCSGNSVLAKFAHNSAMLELLDEIIFDFSEATTSVTGCGCCCFAYEGRTDYTPSCPLGADDAILIGSSPFESYATGEDVEEWVYDGVAVNPGSTYGPIGNAGNPLPTLPCDDDPPADYCCATSVYWSDGEPFSCAPGSSNDYCVSAEGLSCSHVLPNSVWWVGGALFQPSRVSAWAYLVICVEGNVVTLCVTLYLTLECKMTGGEGNWTAANHFGAFCPDCAATSEVIDSEEVTQCIDSVVSTLHLTATADLSAVSGANIWEKIKNAPSDAFVSDYEHAHCNCGAGGCADSYELNAHTDCYISPFNCWGTETEVVEPDTSTNEPIHRDCFYAVGTLALSLDDE